MYPGGYIILRDDIASFITSLISTKDAGSIHIENSYNYAKSIISVGKPIRFVPSVSATEISEFNIVLYLESTSGFMQAQAVVFHFIVTSSIMNVTITDENNVLVSFDA